MNCANLENKKIFVTGGTGFFGKSILDMLERGFLSGTFFVILSREPEKFLNAYPQWAKLKQIRFCRGDVRDFVFPDEQFDCIIHAAAPAVTDLPPGEMRSIIIDGTHRVLNFARHCGAEKLLYISSGAVYGPQGNCRYVPEDFPCRPATEYAIAKLEAEKLCLNAGIAVSIARCFAFAGPHLNRNIHFAIGNFIQNAMDKQDIIIKGDGTAHRSYMYADDLVEWLFTILANSAPGAVYNVGAQNSVSIAELASITANIINPASKVKILTEPVPGAQTSYYAPDISKARYELGLVVKTPLEDAIAATVKAIKEI